MVLGGAIDPNIFCRPLLLPNLGSTSLTAPYPDQRFSGKKVEDMDVSNRWTEIGTPEAKKTEVKKEAVCAEMERLNQLPGSAAKGSYAIQRMRVLNKILQLMAIQRSQSQDEELELLFAGLSI